MDKAKIFTELTLRNAVRREAKLPLLDMRVEFDHAVEVYVQDAAPETEKPGSVSATALADSPAKGQGEPMVYSVVEIDGRG